MNNPYVPWEKIACARCGTVDGRMHVDGRSWPCTSDWHQIAPSEWLVLVHPEPELFVYCWARSSAEALAYARQSRHRQQAATIEAISATGAPLDHDTGFIDDSRGAA